MKTYQSVEEGTWVELLPVQLTKEQRDLIRSNKEEDIEAKQELSALIKSQREGLVDIEREGELNSFYNSIKPELKENDVYQLIAIDVAEKENSFSGILNCRINGEHRQIRF